MQGVRLPIRSLFWRVTIVLAGSVGLTLGLRSIETLAKPSAAGPGYLLFAVAVSAMLGFVEGLVAAIAGAVLFTTFLPPVRMFAPMDWIATGLLFVISVVACYAATRIVHRSDYENDGRRPSGISDASARVAVIFALAVLAAIGVAAYRTTRQLVDSHDWVDHTLQVAVALGDLRAEVLNSQIWRQSYTADGEENALQSFDVSSRAIEQNIGNLRKLTSDNANQQRHLDAIESLESQRSRLQQEAIEARKTGQIDPVQQGYFDVGTRELALQMANMIVAMQVDENSLIEQREKSSAAYYQNVLAVLGVAFAAACVLLLAHFWMLNMELKRRKDAEAMARISEQAARRLSARLLKFQDEERRRFSRELHDGLGQCLASLKLNLALLEQPAADQAAILAECRELLDSSLSETRTISYLLHPPLLDEAGLVSAMQWYLDGFAERSGVEVKLNMPPQNGQRFPQAVELVLFRVLQESLANIHRHSGSAAAEISLKQSSGSVTLEVRDFGHGVPPQVLESFRKRGPGLGVGLAGMRERLHEVGGQLEIASDSSGTAVRAILPVPRSTIAAAPENALGASELGAA